MPSFCPPGEKFGVGAYETRDCDSFLYSLKDHVGRPRVPSLEDAREMLPPDARMLNTDEDRQFLELWEGSLVEARDASVAFPESETTR